jgi:hypothetical protein
MYMRLKFYVLLILLAGAPISATAQIAAGGAFALEKSVVAAGGGASSSGEFTVQGTSGQTSAGTTMSSVSLTQKGGFWTPDSLAPTAASVTVSGRVMTPGGRGIRRALVTITGADGTPRTVLTGSFGYFRFTDVAAGGTYLLSVSAKRFIFSEPTQVIAVVDDLAGLTFVADNEP